MPRFTLRTLDRLALVGDTGPCVIEHQLALPLLVLAALAPGGGIDEDEAMLRLTPDLTPSLGRARLTSAVAALSAGAGAPVLGMGHGRLSVDRDLVAVDVDLAAVAQSDSLAGRFLAGLTPPSPEFGEWVAEVSPRIRTARAVKTQGSRMGTPNDRIAGLIAVGGIALLLAVWATRSSPPPGFVAGDAVVLADLDNATGDTLFDQSLTAAAAVGLRQSAQLSLLPRNRISAALGRMGRTGSDTGRLTLALAQEVAARENTRYALGLRIERAGEGYRVRATLADARTGQVARSAEANAETRAGTLVALDRVLDETRASLGEGRTERRLRSVPIPAATTPSLEALRSYAQGGAAWSTGKYLIARELWERALDLDSGFAMAMGSLGAFYSFHHDRRTARAFYLKALERKARLTEWEQLRLAEGFASLEGDTDSAIALNRTIVARYPSAASWYNYGTELMQAGRPAEAFEALSQSLRFDSLWSNTYINLATTSKTMQRWDSAIAFYRRAAELDSLALLRGFPITEYGAVLVRLGRLDDAERHFRRVLAEPALPLRMSALRNLGLLAIWRGRLDEGVGLLRRATVASIQIDGPGSIGSLRGRQYEGLALVLAGDLQGANRAFDSLMANIGPRVEPSALALFAQGLLHANRVADARSLALNRPDTVGTADRKALAFILAATAIAAGQPDSGMALLAAGATGPQPNLTGWVRVDGLAAQGKLGPARILADSLSKLPAFGNESQFEWLWGVAKAADLAAKAGDRVSALAGYQRLIDLWGPNVPSPSVDRLGPSTGPGSLLDRVRTQVEALRTDR